MYANFINIVEISSSLDIYDKCPFRICRMLLWRENIIFKWKFFFRKVEEIFDEEDTHI